MKLPEIQEQFTSLRETVYRAADEGLSHQPGGWNADYWFRLALYGVERIADAIERAGRK